MPIMLPGGTAMFSFYPTNLSPKVRNLLNKTIYDYIHKYTHTYKYQIVIKYQYLNAAYNAQIKSTNSTFIYKNEIYG